MNALNVLCAQLTRDLFAIAKFLFISSGVSVFLYGAEHLGDGDAFGVKVCMMVALCHRTNFSPLVAIS